MKKPGIYPWEPDVVLSEELIRALVRKNVPRLSCQSVRKLGEGWDFWVYEIDNDFVFRFPKRKQPELDLLSEIKIVSGIGRHLPVRVPNYEWVCKPSSEFPYSFGGYSKLSGESLDKGGSHGVEHNLGQFLSALHSISSSDARNAGIPETHRLRVNLENMKLIAEERLKNVSSFLSAEIQSQVLKCLKQSYVENTAQRVVHNDLNSHHILIDPKQEKHLAVLDWTDTTMGDPACDFGGLLYSLGSKSVETITRSYALSIESNLFNRARFYGVYIALAVLWFAELQKRSALVREAHQGLRRCLNEAAYL